LFTADRLRTALTASFEDLHDGEIMVIDLTDVAYLGSHGLVTLVAATEAAQRWGKLPRIVIGHNRSVVRLIQLTGLADLLALYNTVDDVVHPPA
jgi:anti-sigma B factor antagonist